MTQLLELLIRHSPGIAVFAVLAGVIGGVANAGLVALVNTTLHRDRPWTDTRLVLGFATLCLLLPLAQAVSSYVLTRLSHRTALRLRLELSRKILATPLRQLEKLGSHRLLAALTEDVIAIVVALSSLPLLFVQMAIVAGCLGYLGWLSWEVLLAVVGALLVGVVTYRLPMATGAAYHQRGREMADRLYDHFRAITGGTKELKLHYPRREALVDQLTATGEGMQHWLVRASTIYSAAAGWGQLVIFAVIGGILFLFLVRRDRPQDDDRVRTHHAVHEFAP